MKIDYYERLGKINSVNLLYLWWYETKNYTTFKTRFNYDRKQI